MSDQKTGRLTIANKALSIYTISFDLKASDSTRPRSGTWWRSEASGHAEALFRLQAVMLKSALCLLLLQSTCVFRRGGLVCGQLRPGGSETLKIFL